MVFEIKFVKSSLAEETNRFHPAFALIQFSGPDHAQGFAGKERNEPLLTGRDLDQNPSHEGRPSASASGVVGGGMKRQVRDANKHNEGCPWHHERSCSHLSL